MTWTTARTWTTGEGLLASQMRLYIQNSLRHNIATNGYATKNHRPIGGNYSFNEFGTEGYNPLANIGPDAFAGFDRLGGYGSLDSFDMFPHDSQNVDGISNENTLWFSAYKTNFQGDDPLRFTKREADTYLVVQFSFTIYWLVSTVTPLLLTPYAKVVKDGLTVLAERVDPLYTLEHQDTTDEIKGTHYGAKVDHVRRSYLDSLGSKGWKTKSQGAQGEYPDLYNYPVPYDYPQLSEHFTLSHLSVIERPGVLEGAYSFLPGHVPHSYPRWYDTDTAQVAWDGNDGFDIAVWEVDL